MHLELHHIQELPCIHLSQDSRSKKDPAIKQVGYEHPKQKEQQCRGCEGGKSLVFWRNRQEAGMAKVEWVKVLSYAGPCMYDVVLGFYSNLNG